MKIMLLMFFSVFLYSCSVNNQSMDTSEKKIFINKVSITNVTNDIIEDFKLIAPRRNGFISSGYIMPEKKIIMHIFKEYEKKEIALFTVNYKVEGVSFSKILEVNHPHLKEWA
jgi:hypothetical protein